MLSYSYSNRNPTACRIDVYLLPKPVFITFVPIRYHLRQAWLKHWHYREAWDYWNLPPDAAFMCFSAQPVLATLGSMRTTNTTTLITLPRSCSRWGARCSSGLSCLCRTRWTPCSWRSTDRTTSPRFLMYPVGFWWKMQLIEILSVTSYTLYLKWCCLK